MARSGPATRPARSLVVLLVLLGAVFAAVAGGVVWSTAQWTPKLGLDLEGGTQIVLKPVPQAGSKTEITTTQLNEAVSIIRQRVDGAGVSEAEVTTQGSGSNRTISVALPGNPDKKTLDLVKQSAELTFRSVLTSQGAAAPATAPSASATSSPGAPASPGATSTPKASGSSKDTASAAPTASSSDGRIIPGALTRPAATPGATPAATPEPTGAATTGGTGGTGSTGGAEAGEGTPSALSQITPAIQKEFAATDCRNLQALQLRVPDPAKPLVTCNTEGTQKFILGPVEVFGKNIKSASSGLGQNSQGFSNGEYQVLLSFDGTGTKAFATTTERLANLTGAQNQFAIVLDGLVVSDPGVNERIPTGQAQISGSFTQETAATLASQLKFGALPLSFQVQTDEQISATLGQEQLQHGLLAGLIGLLLVVAYSLLQYRALGLVTVFSLVIAGALTYGVTLLLSWQQGYRLSLAGVAGMIVSIGVTADSFIVFFERVRDEVREGRPLRAAVETAWTRARRTILASDTVSALAAVVLYLLAVGGVRGFAFTLGLTTVIDVLVVFLFTKPTVTLLARTTFFGGGHRLSGFSPEQLGRISTAPTYAGRGRVRPAGESIAARRAAQAAEAETGAETGAENGAENGAGRPSVGAAGRSDA